MACIDGDMTNEAGEEVRVISCFVSVTRKHAHASAGFSVCGFPVFNAMSIVHVPTCSFKKYARRQALHI